jgi:hypothetical protein
MRCKNQFQRRFIIDKRPPQIALQGLGQEHRILLPERQIEPKRLHGAFTFNLVRIRADQDFHRIANGIDADKDNQRHRQHNKQCLQDTPNEVDGHLVLSGSARRRAHILRARQLIITGIMRQMAAHTPDIGLDM